MFKYKTFQTESNKSSAEAIKVIANKYSKEDIYFEIKNGKIITHLKQLDFSNFKDDIRALTKNSNGDRSADTLLAILDKIENIRSYGLKGRKRLYVGYNKERKVRNREQKEQKREIHFYANDNGFAKENNIIPAKFENKVVCADSEKVLKELPGNCVYLIFTSPPYNFGLDYTATDDDHKWHIYFDKLFKIFDECIRVLKYGGRIIVNVQPLFLIIFQATTL